MSAGACSQRRSGGERDGSEIERGESLSGAEETHWRETCAAAACAAAVGPGGARKKQPSGSLNNKKTRHKEYNERYTCVRTHCTHTIKVNDALKEFPQSNPASGRAVIEVHEACRDSMTMSRSGQDFKAAAIDFFF